MNKEDRKAALAQYKQRRMMGGVYRLRNTKTGKAYLSWEDDLDGAENRFHFAVKTGTDLATNSAAFNADWRRDGAAAFVFERLEELEQKEGQERGDFLADLEALCAMHREEIDPATLYNPS